MSAQPTLIREFPTISSQNHFFKSLPKLQLEKGASPLLNRTTNSLVVVNSVGCLLLLDQSRSGEVILIPVDPILDGQRVQLKDEKEFGERVKSKCLVVKNKWMCNSVIPPGQILLSPDELYFAVEVFRPGNGPEILQFLLIYQTIDFIKNGDNSTPLVEVRLSAAPSSEHVNFSILAWNPCPVSDEKISHRVIAISSELNLILIEAKGQNNIEIIQSRVFDNPKILSMCWSPKGKQLVVGLSDGSLRQLKMNLSDAKTIAPPPKENSNDLFLPKSIHWISTHHFLILYEINSCEVDFMFLELAKTAPPAYKSYGDLFTSDIVEGNSACKFIPQGDWNTIICISNTGSDLVLLKKTLDGGGAEKWNIVEIFEDARRASLPIDNYFIGAGLFTGFYPNPLTLSDTEQYQHMPALFMISQTGLLIPFFYVNSETGAPRICGNSPSPFQGLLAKLMPAPPPQQQPQQQPVFQAQQQTSQGFVPPPSASPFSIQKSQTTGEIKPGFQGGDAKPPDFSFSFKGLESGTPKESGFPSLMKQLEKPGGFASTGAAPPPPAYTPISPPLEAQSQQRLKEIQPVHFSPRGGGIQLDRGESAPRKGDIENELELVNQQLVLTKIDGFNRKLEMFKDAREKQYLEINERLAKLMTRFDEDLTPGMSAITSFVEEIVQVTNSQLEDVAQLKKNHLAQYEYLENQRSLMKQSKDPNFLKLKKAQPIPPDLMKKLSKIQTQFKEIKKQVNDACKSIYYEKRNRESPLTNSQTLDMIFKTVSNNSKIIQCLMEELIRIQTAYHKQFGYKPSPGSLPLLTDKEIKGEEDKLFDSTLNSSNADEITFEELISGVSSIKLNAPSIYPHKQPVIMTGEQINEIRKIWAKKKIIPITPVGESGVVVGSKTDEGFKFPEKTGYEGFIAKEREALRKSLTPTRKPVPKSAGVPSSTTTTSLPKPVTTPASSTQTTIKPAIPDVKSSLFGTPSPSPSTPVQKPAQTPIVPLGGSSAQPIGKTTPSTTKQGTVAPVSGSGFTSIFSTPATPAFGSSISSTLATAGSTYSTPIGTGSSIFGGGTSGTASSFSFISPAPSIDTTTVSKPGAFGVGNFGGSATITPIFGSTGSVDNSSLFAPKPASSQPSEAPVSKSTPSTLPTSTTATLFSTPATTAPASTTSSTPASIFGGGEGTGAEKSFSFAAPNISVTPKPTSSIFGGGGITAGSSIFGGGGGDFGSGSFLGSLGDALSSSEPNTVQAEPSKPSPSKTEAPTTLLGALTSPASTPNPPAPSAGNIFGGATTSGTGSGASTFSFTSPSTAATEAKPGGTTSVFGGTPSFGSGIGTGGIFSQGTQPPAFGQTSSPATQASSIFGGGSSTGSIFGGGGAAKSSGGSLFGDTPANTGSASSSIFGGGASATTPASSIFGGGSGSSGSIFGGGSGTTQSGSIFGGTASTQASNIFGGTQSSTTQAPGLFSGGVGGSSSLFGGGGAFGSQNQPTAFGTSQPAQQTGFGQPFGAQKEGGSFGGAATTVFGGTPTFGSGILGSNPFVRGPTPAFGQTAPLSNPTQTPGSIFGGSGASTGSIFGGGTGATFGALASSPTPAFGSPQQQQQQPAFGQAAQGASIFGGQSQQQSSPPSFGGGTSFSSWR